MANRRGANVSILPHQVHASAVQRRPTLRVGEISAASLATAMLAASLIILLIVSVTQLAPFGGSGALSSSDGEGGAARQVTYLILVAVIVGAARIAAPHRPLWPLPLPMTLMLLWCAASLFWSLAPAITLRRLLLTSMIIYSMFQSVQALGYVRAMRVLSYTLFVVLIANYASVALISGAVHHANELAENTLAGSWRGIATHKNMAGGLCAFTAYVFMFESRQFARVTRMIVFIASAYFLYRTQSKTSLGIFGLAMGCGCLFLLYRPRYRVLLIPVIILALVGLVIACSIYLGPLLRELAASEDAFTGRIQIWRVLADYISDNPWLGSGYGAFWNIGPNSPAFSRVSGWVEHIIIGHSGYLDIAAQIGIPGMILAVAAMMLIPLGKIFFNPWMPQRAGAMLVAMLIFSIGHNFTETSLLERDSFLAVILALAGALVYTSIRDAREAASASGFPTRTAWNPLVKPARRGHSS